MYFCRTVNYIMSDLKAADSFLLQFVKPLVNYSVSAMWIKEFTAFLIERQKEFLYKNKRAKEIPIGYYFSKSYPSKTENRASISVGSIYVNFDLIEAELPSFDIDEDNPFYNTIKQIIEK